MPSIDRQVWERISSLFADALEFPAAEREAFLAAACGDSEQIEKEVRRLLVEHDEAGQFLEPEYLTETITGTDPAASRACRPGDLLAARFYIVRLLGAGGMGEVYEAFDSELRQNVAVKTLRSSYAHDPAMVERFRAEVLRSRQITHPNVARVYDLFTHRKPDGGEIPFFTMELLEGQTLSRWIDDRGPLAPDEALRLLEQMASALHAAHSVGIVHRDFKPGNVFISVGTDGAHKAVVTDFGIAAQHGVASDAQQNTPSTSSGQYPIEGTPAYMAPERLLGEPNTPAVDIYALGLVAYEMLTGDHACKTRSPLAVALQKVSNSEPQLFGADSNLPARWTAAIQRAVRRDPAERFSDALEFIRAISGKPGTGNRIIPAAVLCFIAVLSAAIYFALRPGPGTQGQAISLAVLPFENGGGDGQGIYLSDGIADGLVRSLTGFAKLRVVPQSAAAAYRDRHISPREIAKALNVRMLLAGSFRQSGHRLHLNAQLRDESDDKQAWSQTYDADIEQLLTVQSEIVKQVAGRMSLGEPQPKMATVPTANADAYDLFLRARYLWASRTREGITRAIDYFSQAVRLDPKFALAYAGIADAYVMLTDFGSMPPAEATPKARDAVEQALSLDADASEVQASLGLFSMLMSWDQTAAERAFQKSLSRNPSLTEAHHWYASYLERARRLDEALREAQEARRLDPTTPPTLLIVGWVQYYRREFQAAIEIGKQAVELYPNVPQGHDLLALSYAASGQLDLAIKESAEGARLTTDPSVALRRRAQTLSRIPSKEAEARNAARELEKISSGRQAAYLAGIYAALGDREDMYRWAGRALEIHDSYLLIANVDLPFELYRAEPRFQEILHRMGY